jgi:hypothetical protein
METTNAKKTWSTPTVVELHTSSTAADTCGSGIYVNKPSTNSDGSGSQCS